ncbi:1-aminocyclopropane-1-carboxylate synthase-like protein 1 isoform X2 [Lingula anatina]|uniref:1-aminocyclopropane-1-carboxylate synthase-like protein 1 isoform X2 n=1 Tax=Lingula anatina TaxID=7574 RepID=A0A1S3IK33_LINAN|nr:1-aminocyclopropane-1-carboxylate synthase-like protein 1 isoform X2 [Lingula anatina]|eukprot:XP_013398600.1 1-aminocyclopropane-1-carboxylate synthase-like protein 1 isoform X2 [Lingula anatina]
MSHVTGDMASDLSKRGTFIADSHSFLMKYGAQAIHNPYDEKNNPKGIVSMGMAENKLMEDILFERLSQPDMHGMSRDMLYYFKFSGTRDFRVSLANFITERFGTTRSVEPDNVMVVNGCGSALEQVASAVADPGEYLLCPSPYYSMVKFDCNIRGQVDCFDIPLTSQQENGKVRPFQLTLEDVEKAYQDATGQGLVVKGIFLLNPSNPTGDVYSPELLMDILLFAKRHQLHVIADEIYALSVFDSETQFCSVLALPNLPDPDKTHVLWGFSKDFALSGFRCGTIISSNKKLKTFIDNIAYYQCTPVLLQNMMRIMISDKKWLDSTYFPMNRQRMREMFTFVTNELEDLGIKCHPSKAAFFVWANFSPFMSEKTREEEMQLFQKLFAAGVYIIPGTELFCVDPGWFRVLFSLQKPYLQEGLKRLRSVLVRGI